jgi:mannose-6-phosphate isomerase-like protein (cupin superfamily)
LLHTTVNYFSAEERSDVATKKATAKAKPRAGVHLPPDKGRTYAMGPLAAIFKADGKETAGRYSISEWWLDPRTRGPGAHSHEEDDVFYILEGTMSIRVGNRWVDAPKGSFILAPGGVTHDFENRTDARAGMLNLSVPGDFEQHMPGIASWFRKRPESEARTTKAPSFARKRA